MSKILVLGLAAVLTTGGAVCMAQATAGANASGSAGVSGRRVATGNSINAALQGSVDSKKAKVGDPVQAVTRETATLPDGTVLPKGSTLMGHVTQATAGGRSEGDGALGFAFDQVKTRGGRTMPVRLTLLGVAPPVQMQGFADEDAETMAGPVGAGTSVRGAGGAPRAGGGGLVNGATSTVAGAGNTVGSTANGVGGTATGVANSGLDDSARTTGALLHGTGQSVGVIGSAIPNVQLNTGADASSSGVLTSRGRNVRLESGTSMSLGIVAQ